MGTPTIASVVNDMLTTGMGDDGYLLGKDTQASPVVMSFVCKGLMLDALGSMQSVGRQATQAYSTNTEGYTEYYVYVYS